MYVAVSCLFMGQRERSHLLKRRMMGGTGMADQGFNIFQGSLYIPCCAKPLFPKLYSW